MVSPAVFRGSKGRKGRRQSLQSRVQPVQNENEQAKKPIVWSAALTYANEGAKKQSKDWLQLQTDVAEAPELRQQIFSFVRTVSDLHARLGKISAARNEALDKLKGIEESYTRLKVAYENLQKEHAAMIGANKPKKKSGK